MHYFDIRGLYSVCFHLFLMFMEDLERGEGGWVWGAKMYFYVLRLQNVCNGCQRLLFVVRPDIRPSPVALCILGPHGIKYRDPIAFTL